MPPRPSSSRIWYRPTARATRSRVERDLAKGRGASEQAPDRLIHEVRLSSSVTGPDVGAHELREQGGGGGHDQSYRDLRGERAVLDRPPGRRVEARAHPKRGGADGGGGLRGAPKPPPPAPPPHTRPPGRGWTRTTHAPPRA